MSKFTGQNISATYTNILNIGSVDGCNNCLTQNGKCSVTDSFGIPSSICIGGSGTGISVTGAIDGNNNLNIGGNACITGSLNAGNTTIGNTSINGCATVNDTLTVNESLFVGSNADKLCVTNACTSTCNSTEIGGTLTVGGDTAVTGCITATQDVIAYYSSDKRLKNNLNTICNTQSIVNSLTGYSFDWNEESGREGHDLGVIAQDVQEVLPDIVHERDNGYLAVDYIKLIPVLIEEVKRLSAEVEELKSIQTF